MKIFHVSAECYPVAKVGGLADVVGALPKYQTNAGHQACVVMPGYDTTFKNDNAFKKIYEAKVILGDQNFPFSILKEVNNKLGFELYLVEIKGLFDRKEVYGFEDDIERFLSFQMAVLQWISDESIMPSVINCHDHHSGLIPFLLQYCDQYEKLKEIPTMITIHNGLYQGQFGFEKQHYIPKFDLKHQGFLDWDNCINSLAVGIKCAGMVTTVSPSYLDEINQYANGLESLFRAVRYKSKGILNGIDFEVWNPEKDALLEKKYTIKNFTKGKQANKEKLCSQFNLDPSKPLFSFIGRLLNEKGGDLLPESIIRAMQENTKEINLLILGSGNTIIEAELNALLPDYTGNYNTYIGYNEALAHLIYAGSDFLLMPSRVEPCGLNQMYSLRYGTIPVVRRAGGLKDTVVDFGDDGNGICHDQASVEDICYSIGRAVTLFKDKKALEAIRKKGMQTDHSWERVCQEYIETYKLIKK
jgi:starch synthase